MVCDDSNVYCRYRYCFSDFFNGCLSVIDYPLVQVKDGTHHAAVPSFRIFQGVLC